MNGGSYSAVGNVIGHTSAEGNFFFDPDAAHIVMLVFILSIFRIIGMFLLIRFNLPWKLTLLNKFRGF